MRDFEYLKPSSLVEAVEALSVADDAKLIAGGMTLLPTMKLRLASPAVLVDMANLAELRGIEEIGGRLKIGAMDCHADVAASPVVRRLAPSLADLASQIGDVQVRNRGTIGGSISNNDPTADYPAACLGLAAHIQTNKRDIPADEFFSGLFSTVLDANEIVVSIEFTPPRRAAYQKLRNIASGYAVVGVMIAETEEGVRVAVTGAGEQGVFRHKTAEKALTRKFHPDSVADVDYPVEGIMTDQVYGADYRAHLIKVLTIRATAAALQTLSF